MDGSAGNNHSTPLIVAGKCPRSQRRRTSKPNLTSLSKAFNALCLIFVASSCSSNPKHAVGVVLTDNNVRRSQYWANFRSQYPNEQHLDRQLQNFEDLVQDQRRLILEQGVDRCFKQFRANAWLKCKPLAYELARLRAADSGQALSSFE